ncbi:hypothetical protein AeNC1_007533 [Aphanomyces euteiches]|nr:hypothetical protein AeNC1_007533 [Aphanomyces euteiches]
MRPIVLAAPAVVATASALLACDTSKIALATVPTLTSADATTCAANALNGKPLSSLFETTATSQETIAKLSADASCQTWFQSLATLFASFPACEYLGQNVQDFSKLTLAEFLEANNKEINNFDPTRTSAPSPTVWYPSTTPSMTPSTTPSTSTDASVSSSPEPTATSTPTTTTTSTTTSAPTTTPKSGASTTSLAFTVVSIVLVAAMTM